MVTHFRQLMFQGMQLPPTDQLPVNEMFFSFVICTKTSKIATNRSSVHILTETTIIHKEFLSKHASLKLVMKY